MAATTGKDADTVFIVRVMLGGAAVAMVPCLLIAAVAKLVNPSFDAGRLAFDVGWPLGFLGAIVVAQRRHRASTRDD